MATLINAIKSGVVATRECDEATDRIRRDVEALGSGSMRIENDNGTLQDSVEEVEAATRELANVTMDVVSNARGSPKQV